MRKRVLVAVCLLSGFVLSVFAAHAVPIVQVRLSPGAVDFSPLVEAERFVLTVAAPDGKVSRREFAAGEAISFAISDSRQSFADGSYQWELTAAPRLLPADRARLAAARASGDPAAVAEAQRAAGVPAGGLVQSGAFQVAGGAIVDSAALEGKGEMRNRTAPLQNVTAADQVIPDDLIVQGSTCSGFDCVNNESFGFDTIRMKENNTRLQFNDTSVGSFPTNNWQIRANSSDSGGASFLGFVDQGANGASEDGTINFRVTAGAPSHSIFVDSTGRVGYRTSTPVLDLHVRTSNTPAIRLEQSNAGGFTAQTWDIGANEANWFVRDVTGGSLLSFRIRPGAPTSSIDISSDGDVGIGTGSPDEKLHVFGSDGDTTLMVEETSGTGAARQLINLENNGQVQFRMKDTAQTPEWLFTASNAFQIDNLADPGVELQVDPNGTLRVNGTAMTVPDYVFDPSYQLMPLAELEAFVRERRHLPNVPTAEDIRVNGLDLTRMPLILLEKIEQLTLYTVDMQKNIDVLASENAALKARLAALEEKAD